MNRHILGAAFALAATLAAPAFAAPQGYVTLGVGSTHVDLDCSGTTSCDNTGIGGKVVAGWEFLPQVAAEVSFNYLGEQKAVVPFGASDITVTNEAKYIGLGAAWRPSFGNNFGAVVRVGAAFVNLKSTGSGLGADVSFSHDSTHPYVGLGLTYAFDKNLGLEIDWTRVDVSADDGNGGDASATADTFSVAATYHF